jgi:hypothetical protein
VRAGSDDRAVAEPASNQLFVEVDKDLADPAKLLAGI